MISRKLLLSLAAATILLRFDCSEGKGSSAPKPTGACVLTYVYGSGEGSNCENGRTSAECNDMLESASCQDLYVECLVSLQEDSNCLELGFPFEECPGQGFNVWWPSEENTPSEADCDEYATD